MASSKEYPDYILDQLSPADEVSYRAMMGEYLLYCRGKLVGGIYDDRLLIKPTSSARSLLPEAPYEAPYEGAKELLLVEDTDDRDLLRKLFAAVAEEVPGRSKK